MFDGNREDRLWALARLKAAEFAARDDLLACALTGSLARGRVWAGSDLDFVAIHAGPDDTFEDGMAGDIYWEVDVLPLDWLDALDADALLQPPPFGPDVFGDTPLEVLWGAQVLFDRRGALTAAVERAAALARDHGWLRERARRTLSAGLRALDSQHAEPPRRAIVNARRIAVAYGVTAYWMLRGELMSSAIRIPERLADHPAIQQALRAVFGLGGRPAWDAFFAAYRAMPAEIREEADPDMFREILPAVELGMADGGLCHFRLMADGWLPPETVAPLMGFEPDEQAQKARVLDQTRVCLDQIARLDPTERLSGETDE
jgi:hypothetical protein